MTEKEQIYSLSGRRFFKKELEAWCRKKLMADSAEDFEKEICQFILDWFSPATEMTVKTSGSTGEPKVIRLKKRHMEASARATLAFFGLKPGDTVLHCLPMKYIAGKMMVVRALSGSLDLYAVRPALQPEVVPGKVSFAAMVPMQLANMLQDNDGKTALERIEKLIVGGAFVPENVERDVQNLRTEVWQTYGMTETMTHIALRKLNGSGKSEWYRPLPGVSVYLDGRGCLVVDAPETGVKELATNDLAEVHEQAGFKIKGRIDNVVISGGVKLHPEEIERKISGVMPNDFFVGYRPDRLLGQKLVLFIESTENTGQKQDEIRQALQHKLEKFEVPKEIVFVPAFKRTLSGKIDRKASMRFE